MGQAHTSFDGLALADARRLWMDRSDLLVLTLDSSGHLQWINPAGARRLGLEPDSLSGQPLIGGLLRTEDAVARAERLGQQLGQVIKADAGIFSALVARGEADEDVWVLRAHDGTPHALRLSLGALRDPQGVLTGVVAVQQPDPVALSQHDPLTGLPARSLFFDRAEMALVRSVRAGGHVAVLVVDIDGFEQIESSRGEQVADDVLRAVAGRLHFEMRRTDSATRLGRSEFAVLLPDLRQREEALLVAGKIHRALAAPLSVDGSALGLSASVGVAVHPDHGDQLLPLLDAARRALLQARSGGGGVAEC